MEYATIDAFRRDPAKVWDFYSKRLGRARGREAERCPLRARRARAPRARRGGGHAERRPAPPGGRLAAGDRGARLDPVRELPRLRSRRAVRARGRAAAGAGVRASAAQVLKPDVVMFGELLPAGAMEGAIRAGARRAPAARRRLVARGVPGRRAAGGRLRAGAGSRSSTCGPTPYDGRAELTIDASGRRDARRSGRGARRLVARRALRQCIQRCATVVVLSWSALAALAVDCRAGPRPRSRKCCRGPASWTGRDADHCVRRRRRAARPRRTGARRAARSRRSRG